MRLKKLARPQVGEGFQSARQSWRISVARWSPWAIQACAAKAHRNSFSTPSSRSGQWIDLFDDFVRSCKEEWRDLYAYCPGSSKIDDGIELDRLLNGDGRWIGALENALDVLTAATP